MPHALILAQAPTQALIVNIDFLLNSFDKSKPEVWGSIKGKIQQNLSDSYYFGVGKIYSDIEALKKFYIAFGEDYYHYSFKAMAPLVVPEDIEEKELFESGFSPAIAKVQPHYNYYEENFEKVAEEYADHNNDRQAARRMASTRVAAEIGRMK